MRREVVTGARRWLKQMVSVVWSCKVLESAHLRGDVEVPRNCADVPVYHTQIKVGPHNCADLPHCRAIARWYVLLALAR